MVGVASRDFNFSFVLVLSLSLCGFPFEIRWSPYSTVLSAETHCVCSDVLFVGWQSVVEWDHFLILWLNFSHLVDYHSGTTKSTSVSKHSSFPSGRKSLPWGVCFVLENTLGLCVNWQSSLPCLSPERFFLTLHLETIVGLLEEKSMRLWPLNAGVSRNSLFPL